MVKQQSKFKILMFPWLGHSHISTYVELSKKLSATNYFDLYICSTSVNLDSIRATLSTRKFDEESIKLVRLHIPSTPELPPELHSTKNAPSNLLPALFEAFNQSSRSFSEIMDSLKPHLLLYDIFQPWAPEIASSRGTPSILFMTASSVPFSLFHHLCTMGTASTFPFHCMNIPTTYEGESLVRTYTPCNFARTTEIALVKGCREIEGKYADHLSFLCKKKVVLAGPLMADDRNANPDDEASKIMKWLGEKEKNSTVYISFGSECFLSKEQIAEIAEAIELCDGVNFIWVLRFPVSEEEEGLPEGFLARVGERGLVVKWAPQTKILAHSSVGAFVSHCGWNSTVESIYFGVPIVAVPMMYDQPFNARLVVEVGAGVEVEKGGGGCYVGEDVAKAIKKVMREETFCEQVRSRAKILSKKIRMNEIKEMNEAVAEILRICRKNFR